MAKSRCRPSCVHPVFYILETGCQWRALPRDLPPRSTVHDYFIRWQCDRTLGSCIMSFTCRRESRPARRRARPRRSSTARASRARKGGQNPGSGRLRCRQEDQGTQAPCGRRYTRADAWGGHPAEAGETDGRGWPVATASSDCLLNSEGIPTRRLTGRAFSVTI